MTRDAIDLGLEPNTLRPNVRHQEKDSAVEIQIDSESTDEAVPMSHAQLDRIAPTEAASATLNDRTMPPQTTKKHAEKRSTGTEAKKAIKKAKHFASRRTERHAAPKGAAKQKAKVSEPKEARHAKKMVRRKASKK